MRVSRSQLDTDGGDSTGVVGLKAGLEKGVGSRVDLGGTGTAGVKAGDRWMTRGGQGSKVTTFLFSREGEATDETSMLDDANTIQCHRPPSPQKLLCRKIPNYILFFSERCVELSTLNSS